MLASLWGCTVAEAQTRCSPAEFIEWQQFYRIEPWGEERADLRCAMTTSILANVYARKGKRYTPRDFVMGLGGEREKQSWRGMWHTMKQYIVAHNERVNRASS